MTRIFTGDCSSGSIHPQWPKTLNHWKAINGSTYIYPSKGGYHYQSVTVEDPDCGYTIRSEVRVGDTVLDPYGNPYNGERAELSSQVIETGMVALIGETRWYAFSVKFDSTFPSNHADLGDGWGNVFQWKDYPNGSAVPVLSFGWQGPATVNSRNGYWYVTQNPSATILHAYPNPIGNAIGIAEMPLELGKWHDIKIEVKWAQDASGTVRLWRNGSPQTFSNGLTTFTGQTMVPAATDGSNNVTGTYVQTGLYRTLGTGITEIVHHANFRMADSEDSL